MLIRALLIILFPMQVETNNALPQPVQAAILSNPHRSKLGARTYPSEANELRSRLAEGQKRSEELESQREQLQNTVD